MGVAQHGRLVGREKRLAPMSIVAEPTSVRLPV